MNDHRALLLAAAAWSGSFAAWWAPDWAVRGAALLLAIALIAGYRRSWAAAALALACCAGTGTALVAGAGGAPAPAAVGRYLWLEADTNGVARAVRSAVPGQQRLTLPATVVAYGADDAGWTGSVPVRIHTGSPAWSGVAVGSRVRFRGRLHAPEPGAADALVTTAGPVQVLAPPVGLQAPAAAMRAALAGAAAAGGDDAASLVAGLAIGDESRQSPQFAEQMQAAGLSHLTAVSGGNVAIVLAMVLIPLRLVGMAVAAQVGAAAAVLTGYVVLVGPQPSVMRAAAMGAVGILGVLLGGAPRGLPVLGACCLVLLLAAPALSVSLGFALSAVATGALVAVAPPLIRSWRRHPGLRRIPEPVVLAVCVTASAQLATAPLLLAIGAPVSWVALPANVLAAPLVPAITVLGLVAAITGPFVPPLAAAAAALALVPAELLVRIATVAAQHAGVSMMGVLLPLLPALVGVGAVVLLLRRYRNARPTVPPPLLRWLAPLAVAAAGLLLGFPGQRNGIPRDWRIVVCDVGQGAAVLLRDGPATAVLVDTGPPQASAVQCVADAGVAELSAVMITHFHADHSGGIGEVLDAVPVREIVTSGFLLPAAGSTEVARAAADHRVPLRRTGAGERIAAGEAALSLLWPPLARTTGSDDDANNNSLVIRAAWADGFTALVPGDIEPDAQAQLLRSGAGLSSDVVVVPHHGSDYQDPGFADAAGAAVAVISSGAGNSYGHPAPGTVAEYRTAGTAAWRTDESGSVAVAPVEGQLHVSGSG